MDDCRSAPGGVTDGALDRFAIDPSDGKEVSLQRTVGPRAGGTPCTDGIDLVNVL